MFYKRYLSLQKNWEYRSEHYLVQFLLPLRKLKWAKVKNFGFAQNLCVIELFDLKVDANFACIHS